VISAIQEDEAGGSKVQSQPGLESETLSQKINKNIKSKSLLSSHESQLKCNFTVEGHYPSSLIQVNCQITITVVQTSDYLTYCT
jgi:hypothetical protein